MRLWEIDFLRGIAIVMMVFFGGWIISSYLSYSDGVEDGKFITTVYGGGIFFFIFLSITLFSLFNFYKDKDKLHFKIMSKQTKSLNKIYVIVFFLLIYATSVIAQGSIVAKFEVRSHSFQGTTIPYRLFVPEDYDSIETYPLVLALHGAGERGSDNVTHVASYRLATAWADPVNQAQNPCFVVAPQCPEGRSWPRARQRG